MLHPQTGANGASVQSEDVPAGDDLPGWTMRTFLYPYGKRYKFFGPNGKWTQSRIQALRLQQQMQPQEHARSRSSHMMLQDRSHVANVPQVHLARQYRAQALQPNLHLQQPELRIAVPECRQELRQGGQLQVPSAAEAHRARYCRAEAARPPPQLRLQIKGQPETSEVLSPSRQRCRPLAAEATIAKRMRCNQAGAYPQPQLQPQPNFFTEEASRRDSAVHTSQAELLPCAAAGHIANQVQVAFARRLRQVQGSDEQPWQMAISVSGPAWMSAQHLSNLLDDPSTSMRPERGGSTTSNSPQVVQRPVKAFRLDTASPVRASAQAQAGSFQIHLQDAVHNGTGAPDSSASPADTLRTDEESPDAKKSLSKHGNAGCNAVGLQTTAASSSREPAKKTAESSGAGGMEEVWEQKMASLTQKINISKSKVTEAEGKLKIKKLAEQFQLDQIKEESATTTRALEAHRDLLDDRIKALEKEMFEAKVKQQQIDSDIVAENDKCKRRAEELPVVREVQQQEAEFNSLREECTRLEMAKAELASWKLGRSTIQ